MSSRVLVLACTGLHSRLAALASAWCLCTPSGTTQPLAGWPITYGCPIDWRRLLRPYGGRAAHRVAAVDRRGVRRLDTTHNVQHSAALLLGAEIPREDCAAPAECTDPLDALGKKTNLLSRCRKPLPSLGVLRMIRELDGVDRPNLNP